jgi:hypothetical protein
MRNSLTQLSLRLFGAFSCCAGCLTAEQAPRLVRQQRLKSIPAQRGGKVVLLTVLFLAGVVLAAFLLSACSAGTANNTEQPVGSSESRPQVSPEPTTESSSAPTPSPEPTATTAPTPTNTPAPTPTPKPEPDRSAAYIYEKNPKLTPVNYDSPALLAPTEDMGQAYIDKITFICDSPTYWMWPYGLFSDGKASKQIWTGPEGTMTLAYQGSYKILDPYDRTERPIRAVVERHKPEYIIIALGINGISFMKEKYFTDEYTDLVTSIQRLSPETTIILQSIYPITHRYKHYGNITNAMITEGNSWILKIAEKTGCKYLDTISVLLNDEGNAKDELMRKDGLHPNVDGLKLILEYIRTHGYVPERTHHTRRKIDVLK